MSGAPTVELEFGGETRTFGCSLGVLRKIQLKCDAGPGEIAQRLAPFMVYGEERSAAQAVGAQPQSMVRAMASGRVGSWRIDDVREPIFQGLIGAGMTPNDAGRLVREFVDERPLLESVPVAFAICAAALMGVEDETAGESAAGAAKVASPSRAASSASAMTDTTPPAARPASRRARSTK